MALMPSQWHNKDLSGFSVLSHARLLPGQTWQLHPFFQGALIYSGPWLQQRRFLLYGLRICFVGHDPVIFSAAWSMLQHL